jgi:hypothetical protein
MKALITNLMAILPPERSSALQHWDERLQGIINRTFDDAEERMAASVADRQGLGSGKTAAVTVGEVTWSHRIIRTRA